MMESRQTRQRFGNAEFDLSNLLLTVDGMARELEPKSFRLLAFLIENRRRVVPKDEILSVVWEGVAVSDNALTRAIAQVRKSLDDDPKQPRYIETIPTVGYRFIAEVAEVTQNVPLSSPAEILPRPQYRRLIAWGVATLALVAASLGTARFFGWGQRGPSTAGPVTLTTYPGSEFDPSFSPDGRQVAFDWEGDQGDNRDIYVKDIGSEAALRLTTDPAPDVQPAWSPDGRVIALQRILRGQRVAVMLVPPLGGRERKLAEFPVHWILPGGGAAGGTGLSWSPDGKWLAVSGDTLLNGSNRILLVSAETGEVRPLTQPPSNAWSDYTPAFSPDGREIVFTRSLDISSGDLYRLALGPGFSPRGNPEKIPTAGVERPISAAWASGGTEILFVSQGLGELYRMPVVGTRPPEKLPLGTGVRSFALSADGRRLAYSVMIRDPNIWRLDLESKGASPERFISSTKRDTSPIYSPDGRRIAFSSNRSGNYQIWVCDADGAKAGAVTSMKRGGAATPHWSPDGRMILFDSVATGHYEVYTVNVDGGMVNQITHGQAAQFGGTWSRDGRWIYYASTAEGEPQVWKVPSQGGAPVRVTHNGGMMAIESLDGKTLYYSKQPGRGSLWRLPLAGGPEEKISDSIYRFNYAVAENGVYVTRNGGIDFIESATGKTRSILRVPQPDLGLDLSPDGRYLLYVQVDSLGSDLMLMEGFR